MTSADIYSFLQSFKALQEEAYNTAKEHGFHENDDHLLQVPTALALIHDEVSEALRAHRKMNIQEMPAELADIVIRTMDLAALMKIELADAIIAKHLVNQKREFKHGNNLY